MFSQLFKTIQSWINGLYNQGPDPISLCYVVMLKNVSSCYHPEIPQILQNCQFGPKFKIPKKMSKTFLRSFLSRSVQTNKLFMIAKIGNYAKAIFFAKLSVWFKNENSQKHAKNHFTTVLSCSVQKTALKKKWHSKNRKFSNIAKIGRYAKAIASVCKS